MSAVKVKGSDGTVNTSISYLNTSTDPKKLIKQLDKLYCYTATFEEADGIIESALDNGGHCDWYDPLTGRTTVIIIN